MSLRLPVSTTDTEHVTSLGNPVLSRLYTDDTVIRQVVAMVKYLKLHGFGCKRYAVYRRVKRVDV